MIIVPNTSTINLSDSYFYCGGLDYNDVNLTNSGWVAISGSNTFNTLNIPNASTISFEGGTTNTFNNLIIPSGTGCNDYFNLQSSISGSATNLIMSAGSLLVENYGCNCFWRCNFQRNK